MSQDLAGSDKPLINQNEGVQESEGEYLQWNKWSGRLDLNQRPTMWLNGFRGADNGLTMALTMKTPSKMFLAPVFYLALWHDERVPPP
jgi:hypothetical protein